ncbi:MAG TPA: TetR family transcriptional regulator [Aliidongia sp.]|nr:TetR family transcriptional regulator [Aliidongia sp.]
MARKSSSSKGGSAKTANPPQDLDGTIINAALALAADRPWSGLALADIATAAGIGLIDLYRTFRSKAAILGAFSRRIDAATIELPADADATARDRLFEVLMRRFDLLAPYKPGLRGLAREACRARLDVLPLACHLPRSLRWMLEASGVSTSGLKGRVRVKLLGLAYLSTVRVWLEDDSEDLAKTMAALDRALRRAEPFMRLPGAPAGPSAGEAAA